MIKDFAIFCAAMGALFGGIVAIAYAITAYQCSAYEDATGFSTRMAGATCFVKDEDGVWLSWEEWKVRGIGNKQRN